MPRLTEFNKPLSVNTGESVDLAAPGGAIVCALVTNKQLGSVVILNTPNREQISQLFSRLVKVSATTAIQPSEVSLKMLGDPEILKIVESLANAAGIRIAGQSPLVSPHLEGQLNIQSGTLRVLVGDNSPQKRSGPTRILIVDDSSTIRKILRNIFSAEAGFEVVADIENPLEAEAAIERFKPDVCTLDIHMPQMDGITLLKRIVTRFKLPCVMVSTITREEGINALGALEHGAIDYIEKPTFDEFEAQSPLIREKVKAAAGAKVRPAPLQASPISSSVGATLNQEIPIVIGSSTGGTEALRTLLSALPSNIPPILIVQHIPAVFSAALAQRLSQLCKFPVKEAKDGEAIQKGHAYIAPGGIHMHLKGKGMDTMIRLAPEPAGTLHTPSVDVMFEDALKSFGGNCVGVILTGMGSDGAKGLLELRKAGANTVGQDEQSCVVYGMPRKAFELGAVETQLPLEKIPEKLCQLLSRKKKAA